MNTDSVTPGNAFPPKVYPSKLDRWYVAATWLFISICVIPPFILIDTSWLRILLVSTFLIFFAIDLSNVRNTYYVLEDDHLLIRMGWFSWRTIYTDIVEVRPFRIPFPLRVNVVYGLSRDSLFILHRRTRSGLFISLILHRRTRNGLFISPEDKEAFMRDLAARAPNLIIQEGRVIRLDKADPGATQQNG